MVASLSHLWISIYAILRFNIFIIFVFMWISFSYITYCLSHTYICTHTYTDINKSSLLNSQIFLHHHLICEFLFVLCYCFSLFPSFVMLLIFHLIWYCFPLIYGSISSKRWVRCVVFHCINVSIELFFLCSVHTIQYSLCIVSWTFFRFDFFVWI